MARAIESCLNQTYENLEIIIVDNASTDGSCEIIKAYQKKSDKIKFFQLDENRFPSGGTNFAVKQTKGEYVAILSGDDFFQSNKIEVQLNYMLESNLTNSFTWVNVVDDRGENLVGHEMADLFNQNFTNEALKEYFVSKGNALCALTFMFHKDLFEKYGYFDHRLLQLQDFEFWLRIIKHEPIYILPQKLTNYCIRDDTNNLSLGRGKEVVLRSTFEYTHVMRHVVDFDLQTLSNVTGKTCTEENKYKNLFQYYKKEKKFAYANGVLFSLYERLGDDFEFPSSKYKDFFDIYSKHDVFQVSYESLIKISIKKIIPSKLWIILRKMFLSKV
jgi:glycosyltransferase involved in cell wall biosynthesis